MSEVRSRATLSGLAAILIWGATIPWMRTVSDALGPMAGGTWMCVISAVLLWGARAVAGRRGWPRVSARTLAVNGTFFTTYMVCFTAAIGFAATSAESVAVGLVNYLWPSLAMLFAPFFAGRSLRPLLVVAVLVALLGTGVALLGGGDAAAAFSAIAARPAPYALAALAALCWALYSNTASIGVRDGDESAVVVYASLAAIGTTCVTAATGGLRLSAEPGVIVSVVLLGVANAFGYLGWDNAVRFGNRRLVGTAALFTPVLSVSVATISFGRAPQVHVWIGALLLVGAALVASRANEAA